MNRAEVRKLRKNKVTREQYEQLIKQAEREAFVRESKKDSINFLTEEQTESQIEEAKRKAQEKRERKANRGVL